jgi:hypothetical protein
MMVFAFVAALAFGTFACKEKSAADQAADAAKTAQADAEKEKKAAEEAAKAEAEKAAQAAEKTRQDMAK